MNAETKNLTAVRDAHLSWAQRAPTETRNDYFLRMAERAPDDCLRHRLLWHAEACKHEARLIEESRKGLSESWELLARTNATPLVPPKRTFGSERSLHRGLLHVAMERVFDRWIDEKASPLPRSTSMH